MGAAWPPTTAILGGMSPAAAPSPQHASPTRGRFDAVVESNTRVCREHWRLRLRVQGALPPSQPGQFIQLGCRPPGDATGQSCEPLLWSPDHPPAPHQPELLGPVSLLRRPFSLSGRGENARGTWLEIVHRVVGTGTNWLATLRPNDAVDFIGPLGNQFTLPQGKRLGLLIGGGVGLPPMFYLSGKLAAAGWDAVAFVGAQTADLLAVTWAAKPPTHDATPSCCARPFADNGFASVVTTDDGSLGLRGLITTGVERFLATMPVSRRRDAVAFVCGPLAMMRVTTRLTTAAGIETQVCMEQAMACGMGTCQSCIVRVQNPKRDQETCPSWRYQLCCTDGPVFDGRTIVW